MTLSLARSPRSAAFQLLRERDVRVAVERDEFIPFFQPIMGAGAGELRGFEALVRWRNPEEGILPPSMFLDVLEETGLIEVVGRRVIREACEQAARWFASTGALIPVSVNIAAAHLAAPDFCDHIAWCLAECGLPPAGLFVETTEQTLVADKASTQIILGGLVDLGVRIRIDHFGTGHSRLADLHELSVSGIKLDQSLFDRAEGSPKRREILRAIAARAHEMEMDVIVVGIETMSQLQRVRELGCDFAQGYGFSHPLSADQAVRYARRHMALWTQVTLPRSA